MCVSILLVVVINIAADEHVAGALEVFTRHIFGVHDGESDLVVFDGLRRDIPHLLLFVLLVARLNLEPACDDSL